MLGGTHSSLMSESAVLSISYQHGSDILIASLGRQQIRGDEIDGIDLSMRCVAQQGHLEVHRITQVRVTISANDAHTSSYCSIRHTNEYSECKIRLSAVCAFHGRRAFMIRGSSL